MKRKLSKSKPVTVLLVMLLIAAMIPSTAFATLSESSEENNQEYCKVTINDYDKLEYAFYNDIDDQESNDSEVEESTFNVMKGRNVTLYLSVPENEIITEVRVNGKSVKIEEGIYIEEIKVRFMSEKDTIIDYKTRERVEKVSVSPEETDFGFLPPGYKQPEKKEIILKNTGDYSIAFEKIKVKNYEISYPDIKDEQDYWILAPGEESTVEIKPVSGLPLGEYNEKLVFKGYKLVDGEIPVNLISESEIKPSLTVTASVKFKVEKEIFGLELDKHREDFGTLIKNYSWSEYRVFTVTNTGNRTLTLENPVAENYYVAPLTKKELAPGEKATFSLQPVQGIKTGKYAEDVVVYGSYEGKTVAQDSAQILIEVAGTSEVGDDKDKNNDDRKPEVPLTGDKNNFVLLGLLLAGSAVTLAGLKKKMSR